MNDQLQFHDLDPNDAAAVEEIAGWYSTEWHSPIERSRTRLANYPSADTLLHVVVRSNQQIIAAGGIWTEVNLFNTHPKYRNLRPWISALYTLPEFRQRGIAQDLLSHLESRAKVMGYQTIFLYTSTAESLYKRNGWTELERIIYKGEDTVIMEKSLI